VTKLLHCDRTRPQDIVTEQEYLLVGPILGLPYVRFFPDMSGILVAKYASGRNAKTCSNVRDFGIMHFMKSNCNVFTIRII